MIKKREYSSRWEISVLNKFQSFIQSIDDIVFVFQTDGKTDQLGKYSGAAQIFFSRA